jgi:SpoVK/Ycf46/Vps4 family AAA+-type ATPase
MARADLLKQVFKSYKDRDDKMFREAASQIIDEERKKKHIVLANELKRIVNDHPKPIYSQHLDIITGLEPLPKDKERDFPLLSIKFPNQHLQDLILDNDQLETIKIIITEFQQWDVLHAYGLQPAVKLLFCGPPGCGKTVSAEAIANELGLPMLYVRFDAVVSSLLGETAANLRRVLDYAKQGSWVLFFDEFDAIGRSRDDATEHGELKRVVNAFLQMTDEFDGQSLIIAATNFEQSLDLALWRRFDEIIRFDLPNEEQIHSLVVNLLSERILDLDINGLVKALKGTSHADIERVCVGAIKSAILRGVLNVSKEDIDQVMKREKRRRQIFERSVVNSPKIDAK